MIRPGCGYLRGLITSLAFLLCTFLVPDVHAGPEPANYTLGNELYAAGKFQEAKQAYESAVRSGEYSANLFHNLGNTEFRLGDLGRAALNYERALALEPSLIEARANLNLVRSQTGAKIPSRSWKDFFYLEISPNTYGVLATVLGWTALFLLVAACFRRPRQGLILGATLSLLLCSYCVAAIRFLDKGASFALVIAKRSDARFAPLETSPLAETLSAGSHVRILNRSGAWIYCQLPSGNPAWLQSATIEPLRPEPATSQEKTAASKLAI